jgi:hypothetical protein
MNSLSLRSIICWMILAFYTASVQVPFAGERKTTLTRKQQANESNALARDDLDFKETMVGEQGAPNGTHLSFHTWRATDGITVTSSMQEFRSIAQAKKAFAHRLKEAVKVTDRKPRLGQGGRETGERALASFSYPNKTEQFLGIIWTDGLTFHDVESVSLPHALAFEKRFYSTSDVPRPAGGTP